MAAIDVDDLADEVMKGLQEYSALATDTMKKAVRKAGNTVKKEIKENAPVIKETSLAVIPDKRLGQLRG